MADQGAIGRNWDILTNTAALRAAWRYIRVGARNSFPWGGVMRDIYNNTAAMRAKPKHSVYAAWMWQNTQAVATIEPSTVSQLRPFQLSTLIEYGTLQKILRQDGYIQGVVTDATTPVANVLVVLLWRYPIKQIAWTRTNASGVYRFDYLDSTQDAYCCVHFDPAGGTQWNAARLDWLTPTVY